MRYTLLPQSERAALQREYRIRALIVGCFTLCLAGLVGIGALFPSFMSASGAARAGQAQLADLEKSKDQSGATAIVSQLASDQALVSALSQSDATMDSSSLIEDIVLARGDVSLTSFALSGDATGTFAVVIEGTAPTREDLLAFKARLEGLATGNKVDLPISELGPSDKVPFSLQLSGSVASAQHP